MNDLISRQAAVDGADAIIAIDTSGNNDVVKAMTAWKEYIIGLPSAQPEIIMCKECRHNGWCSIQEVAMAGYCFFCGAEERRTDD